MINPCKRGGASPAFGTSRLASRLPSASSVAEARRRQEEAGEEARGQEARGEEDHRQEAGGGQEEVPGQEEARGGQEARGQEARGQEEVPGQEEVRGQEEVDEVSRYFVHEHGALSIHTRLRVQCGRSVLSTA